MRKIKFRFWDEENKKFVETSDTDFRDWCIRTDGKAGWISKYGYLQDGDIKFITLQYTGLKDKNGKEIYEGDILKYSYHRDMSGKDIVEFSEVVAWEDDMEWSGFSVHKTMEHEIIGNIYENPELLNSEQEDKRSVATEDQSGNKS